jgi:UDP-N-acetylglucosamine diphosphorylase/glucosamine-1-phosphate N-acetyltransferase
MAKYLAVFEDSNYADFHPLALSRPVWGLRFGTGTLGERIARAFPGHKPLFFCRPEVAFAADGKVNVNLPADCDELLLINGRSIWPEKLKQALKSGSVLLNKEGEVAAAKLGGKEVKARQLDAETVKKIIPLPGRKVPGLLAHYLWDLVAANGRAIETDFALLKRKGKSAKARIDRRAAIHNPKQVYLSPGCELGAFTVLDARSGPIYLCEKVKIQPFSRIEGPAYVGAETQLLRANLRGGCSIGPGCRIGGEVEATIIQGWTNKYHSGFLGHAFLGEWINLGAGTTNSDLKNDYGAVKVWKDGKEFSTGEAKVGSFLGDHVKTGIGTLLNTGIQIGFSANLYGGALFEKKFIPSFAWGTPGRMVPYKVDKAIEVARTVKARRNQTLSADEERLFRTIYEKTEKEREEFLNRL